mgnify:CR=1 FL=1
MPLRQQDILSGKDTKLLRVELNKQRKSPPASFLSEE